MNEELDYAEMLEIPVETVTVKRREKKKRRRTQENELSEQLVDRVNDRMEEAEEETKEAEEDPNYAESKEIVREGKPKRRLRAGAARKILIGEVVAVCALCAVIFFTNIFMTNSAINVFVRGLFEGGAAEDTRTYSDFTLSPVVSENADAEITVSESGVLTFTAKCSVYAPAAGSVSKVSGNGEDGYSVEVMHSKSFSTIISGLDAVYLAEGDEVKSNLPIGFSGGERAVRVMMYDGNSLLNCYTVNGGALSWS